MKMIVDTSHTISGLPLENLTITVEVRDAKALAALVDNGVRLGVLDAEDVDSLAADLAAVATLMRSMNPEASPYWREVLGS